MRTFLGLMAIPSLSPETFVAFGAFTPLFVWNSAVFEDLRQCGRNLEDGVIREVLMELAEEALHPRLKEHQKIVFSMYHEYKGKPQRVPVALPWSQSVESKQDTPWFTMFDG